jgi:hypothetical protein
MNPLSPAELIGLSEELQRLLTFGQPPAISLEIRRRFVAKTAPLGDAAWTAFTFPVALALVRQLPSLSMFGFAPETIDSLRELVRSLRPRPVPAWSAPVDWPGLCARALERLDRPEPAIAAGEVGIPVVMKPATDGATHPLFSDLTMGGMLRLRVDADFAAHRGPGPRLIVEGDTATETRFAFESALRGVGALRAWGAPPPNRCVFRAVWDAPGARLVGRSGGLGFFLAAATARARLSPTMWERALANGIAATGDIRETTVIPVDPNGLDAKLRASHHARIRILLVPKDQARRAAGEADSLERASPGHHVRVIGVGDVRELWEDRSVVRRHARGSPVFIHGLLTWLTRSPVRMALMLALFAAIAGGSIVTAVRWEHDPVAAEWRSERLVMRNRYSHEWSVSVATAPAPRVYSQPDWGAPVVVLKPPGYEHAIVVSILGAGPQGSERLAALTPEGHVLWERDARRVGARHHAAATDVCWLAIYSPGPDPDGSLGIYGLRRSIQGNLCMIDRIDAASGASRGCLRNQGHLEFCRQIDLDNDGGREIVFMGTHNPDSCGIAIVIDPVRMRPLAESDSLGAIPNVSDPSSLQDGVAACWRFAKDRFSTQLRSTCDGLFEDGDGIVRLSVSSVAGEGGFLYRLLTTDLRRPVLLGVQITDGYRAYHDERAGKTAPADEVTVEEVRLAGRASTLTEQGWTPMSREPGGISREAGNSNEGKIEGGGPEAPDGNKP